MLDIIFSLKKSVGVPAILALSGTLLSATAVLWSTYLQNQAQRSSDEKTQKISDLNQKILALTEENKEVAKQGVYYTTGGAGFVYIDIVNGMFSDVLPAVVQSVSVYPQYDISVRIVDLDWDVEQVMIHSTPLQFGTIPPMSDKLNMLNPVFDLRKKGQFASFNLFISARNGEYVEKLRLFKTVQGWRSVLRVETLGSGTPGSSKILYEKIMPDFPVDQMSKFDWN